MSIGLVLAEIVGTPYRFPPSPPKSFDCWSLVTYVREQLGLETKLDVDVSLYDLETMAEAVRSEKRSGGWKQVTSPRDGDAILFTPSHIGVYMGSGVLHAHAPSSGVIFTKWSVAKRRWPQLEVWRP